MCASHEYLIVMSMLIYGMLVHGYNTDDLLKSVLLSTPKDMTGNPPDSDNYRPYAKSLIMQSYGGELYTFVLQLACQQNHSTISCISILHEVVNYYSRNDYDGYACLTHWGRDKMAAVSQTTFSNAFSWMKMLEFRFKFHWSLFLRVQLTTFQHLFR